MPPILVFDIETIPDTVTGKKLYPELAGLSEADTLSALMALRQSEVGNSFMQHPLHKIACLSFLWFDEGQFTLKSLSLDSRDERSILSTFLRAFDKKPIIVSWNGSGFDLPVLLYRMTHHHIDASPIMNAGFKQNDYLNRYSEKHVDLMDKFSFGVWSNKQKLDTIASLCGFAGKGDLDGSQVVPMVLKNQWHKLTNYCESDVINTWFIYLRWLVLTGKMDEQSANTLLTHTQDFIQSLVDTSGKPRHQQFLQGWQES
ncbi:3'-5' exonuclease [Moraxella nasovis]|uniref:3'-5' exonuclease n=1 Tax=Moraxella nasovis TaxID=2904121 RepID=UPI001F615831|nr:3'-5' exonuclease [Moraxella nasovis]UNU74075.1 3'-5' exonuclease [Moraxella nasovis]